MNDKFYVFKERVVRDGKILGMPGQTMRMKRAIALGLVQPEAPKAMTPAEDKAMTPAENKSKFRKRRK